MGSIGTPDPQMQPSDPSTASPIAPGTSGAAVVPAPDAGPQKPAVWKNILQGALEGLAGSKGATSLGAGIAGGVGGVLQAQQQDKDNALKQQASAREDKSLQLTGQFQSAQAAQAVAMAKVNTARAAAMPQEASDAHKVIQVGLASNLQSLGITPVSTSDDTHDSSVAALNQLGATRGSIPHLFTLELDGQHVAYDLGQLSQSPQGLTLINNMREATGQPALTPQQWSQTPPAAKTQASEGALKFFAPPAPASEQQANGTYLQYKSTLDAYMKKPNPNPDVVKGLTDLTAKLKQISDGMKQASKADKYNDAYAQAEAQKRARLDVDEEAYKRFAANDVTGWKPKDGAILSEQQIAAANNKLTQGPLKDAQSAEKSYEMFNSAYAERATATTGAGSMLALSTHLATTFGNVKGSRVTKDMIHEHLGARNVSEDAQAAVQKLVGDGKGTMSGVLTENQWNDFKKLITESRNISWKSAIQSAHSMGVPVTSDMVPSDALTTKNKYAHLGAVPVRN